jgi:hypothetical protein
MSIAERMKQAIELYAAELATKTQLAEIAQRGELTPRAMALYLESLRYLFQHTQRHLTLAAARCERLGRRRLAEYFRCKSAEEQGHDRWAINDLSRLPAKAVAGVRPAPAVRALVELQARFIQEEPLCFVAYLQWAEYFSVHVGDAWLDALAKSGYQRSQVSAIDKHLELDRDHAAIGFRQIDELVEGGTDPASLLGAIEQAGAVFARLCDEICSEARSAA